MRIEQTRKLLSAGILPSPAPTQNIDALRDRLSALQLSFAAESLGDLLSEAVKEQSSAAAFLDSLLRLEIERQEERRITQAIRICRAVRQFPISTLPFSQRCHAARSKRWRRASGLPIIKGCCCRDRPAWGSRIWQRHWACVRLNAGSRYVSFRSMSCFIR